MIAYFFQLDPEPLLPVLGEDLPPVSLSYEREPTGWYFRPPNMEAEGKGSRRRVGEVESLGAVKVEVERPVEESMRFGNERGKSWLAWEARERRDDEGKEGVGREERERELS